MGLVDAPEEIWTPTPKPVAAADLCVRCRFRPSGGRLVRACSCHSCRQACPWRHAHGQCGGHHV